MKHVAKLVKLKWVGLDGNAWALMGAFQQAAKSQGISKEEIKKVLDDCMSSGYDHLLQVLIENTQ